jgi:hypothetical protein
VNPLEEATERQRQRRRTRPHTSKDSTVWAAGQQAQRDRVRHVVVTLGIDTVTAASIALGCTPKTVRRYWPEGVEPQRDNTPGEIMRLRGEERDADVLDSLRALGPSTVADLDEDTGRRTEAVRRALYRSRDRGLVYQVTTGANGIWAVREGK